MPTTMYSHHATEVNPGFVFWKRNRQIWSLAIDDKMVVTSCNAFFICAGWHHTHSFNTELNGEVFTVYPVIMLTEGVHSGSGGATLYTAEELELNAIHLKFLTKQQLNKDEKGILNLILTDLGDHHLIQHILL